MHDPFLAQRSAMIHGMIRHVLAPVVPGAARALGLPRTLAGSAGVTLTFDDGPHPEGTPAVLEVLARAHARATFFVVGEQVERRPDLVARIAAEGHLVAVHGYRHRLQARLSPAQVRRDVTRAVAVVREATGQSPLWHRPPYGIYSRAGLSAAIEAGLEPLLWSRWGKDWRRLASPDRIATRSTRAVLPGDVILLHDADFYSSHNSHRRTVLALSLIVGELDRRKLDTVLPV
jgi:peptidoglycan/xylan/chitin deacetylase (PgdA/CDA1 family)